MTEETDTSALVEFCEDTTGITATKDGKPYEVNNTGEGVGSFTLTRESTDRPWLISEKGYYEKGVTCASHFGSCPSAPSPSLLSPSRRPPDRPTGTSTSTATAAATEP